MTTTPTRIVIVGGGFAGAYTNSHVDVLQSRCARQTECQTVQQRQSGFTTPIPAATRRGFLLFSPDIRTFAQPSTTARHRRISTADLHLAG